MRKKRRGDEQRLPSRSFRDQKEPIDFTCLACAMSIAAGPAYCTQGPAREICIVSVAGTAHLLVASVLLASSPLSRSLSPRRPFRSLLVVGHTPVQVRSSKQSLRPWNAFARSSSLTLSLPHPPLCRPAHTSSSPLDDRIQCLLHQSRLLAPFSRRTNPQRRANLLETVASTLASAHSTRRLIPRSPRANTENSSFSFRRRLHSRCRLLVALLLLLFSLPHPSSSLSPRLPRRPSVPTRAR